MASRWLLISGVMGLAFACEAPAQDYYHRDPDRPDCRYIRVDNGRAIRERYMCRGGDGEWHEAEDEAPDSPAPRRHRSAAASEPRETSGVVGADTAHIPRPGTYRQVSIRLSNIDDLGLVMVIPSMGKPAVIASPQWNVQNQGGSARVDIGPRLAVGRNVILFVLHNKRWIFGASKWAFNATLEGDGTDVWHAARLVGQGGVGIQYWKAIYAEKHADGTIKVATLSDDNVTRLGPRVATLNRKLIRDYGTEQSAYAVAAGVVVAGIMGSMSGGGGEGRGQTVIYRPGQPAQPEYEPAPEPNTYGLYGNCHNPMGC